MLGTFGILFCSYRLYLRDKYFIDRKNKTLHTMTLMKKLDKKVKELEQFKTKWVYMTAGAIAALGFVSGHATTLLALFK